WKPMRRASLLLPTVGSDSTAVCIGVAALAAASGDGYSSITSSPIAFTTRPPSVCAGWRSRSMLAPPSWNAGVSSSESQGFVLARRLDAVGAAKPEGHENEVELRLVGKPQGLFHAARLAQHQRREGSEEPVAKRAAHAIVFLDHEHRAEHSRVGQRRLWKGAGGHCEQANSTAGS